MRRLLSLKANLGLWTKHYQIKIEAEIKSIKKFKRGYFTCRNCEYLKASADKIKYRQKKEILIKCISDKTILRFNNTIDIMNSGIISRPTFRKILKTGEKNFKSFKTKKEYLIVSVI